MTAEEYRQAASALARETKMPAAAAARMEQRLLTAMAAAQSSAAPTVTRRPEAWRSWVAAAASIALILAAVSMWLGILRDGRMAAVPPSAPAVPVMQAIGPLPSPAVIDQPVSHSPKRVTPAPPRGEDAVTPSGFVALPWTAGLPAFESGEIVRMEVPVASLPAYGIDISSRADRPVEADILIGQDGLARAIRLVTNTVRSTQ
jgi:hypothetical protein